jgi:TPR repeat protein
MITRSRFYRLALEANERQTNVRDVDVLPIPTLDERVTLYLRAVHGNRDFTEEERSSARNVLLNSMAAEIAAHPAEQSPKGELPGRQTTRWADLLAQYSLPEESAQGQEWAEPEVTGPLPPHPYEAATGYWQGVQRNEAISVAPRRRTSILALTATLGLVLIVTGGTLGYRWTYLHLADEVTAPAEQARVAPPTTSPRSLSARRTYPHMADEVTAPAETARVSSSATPLAAMPAPPLTMPPRPTMPPTPLEAFRSGTQALRQGKTDQAVTELEYSAEQGVPGAIWKLGRMYADGDGVKMNKARAYDYFRRLTTMHADDGSSTPSARFLANAFVTLGLYHLDGIPGTLKADPNVAREMFRYAASYFADPEAQYYLGRLFLLGKGAPKDAIEAARWLRLSANKGDHRAQALLGGMLFNGEQVSRQASLGLFWLIVAKDAAGPDEGWITEMYSSALAQASESERALAHKYLEDWLKNRRE